MKFPSQDLQYFFAKGFYISHILKDSVLLFIDYFSFLSKNVKLWIADS